MRLFPSRKQTMSLSLFLFLRCLCLCLCLCLSLCLCLCLCLSRENISERIAYNKLLCGRLLLGAGGRWIQVSLLFYIPHRLPTFVSSRTISLPCSCVTTTTLNCNTINKYRNTPYATRTIRAQVACRSSFPSPSFRSYPFFQWLGLGSGLGFGLGFGFVVRDGE